jgi:hypothetical protein
MISSLDIFVYNIIKKIKCTTYVYMKQYNKIMHRDIMISSHSNPTTTFISFFRLPLRSARTFDGWRHLNY